MPAPSPVNQTNNVTTTTKAFTLPMNQQPNYASMMNEENKEAMLFTRSSNRINTVSSLSTKSEKSN